MSSVSEIISQPPKRFRSAPSGHDGVVKLLFTSTDGPDALYAHSSVLKHWSGVLPHVIEDAATQPTRLQEDDVGADSAAERQRDQPGEHMVIPVDDTETVAWEEALSIMYPTTPLFHVTWDNASRLLLLADKYDMPCITEHVKEFLSSRASHNGQETTLLEQHLTAENAFAWLVTTSKVSLEEHALLCINYIVNIQLAIKPGIAVGLAPRHVEQLCTALQQRLGSVTSKLAKAESELEQLQTQVRDRYKPSEAKLSDAEAELRCAAKASCNTCRKCLFRLFIKPNGKDAGYCMKCTVHAVPSIFTYAGSPHVVSLHR